MHVLDEVVEAIELARGARLRLVSEVGLEELLGGPLTPKHWATIRNHLACGLPPLVLVQGHWFLPDGFETVWDLADAAADAHPDWKVPETYTAAAWRDAQIFTIVREVLVDTLSVYPEQVTREARLVRDLGA